MESLQWSHGFPHRLGYATLSAVTKISHFNHLQPLKPLCGHVVLCKCRECPFFLEAACNVRLCDGERDSLDICAFCQLLPLASALLNCLLFLSVYPYIWHFVHTVISIIWVCGFLTDTLVLEWYALLSLYSIFIFQVCCLQSFQTFYLFASYISHLQCVWLIKCVTWQSCAREAVKSGIALLCLAKFAYLKAAKFSFVAAAPCQALVGTAEAHYFSCHTRSCVSTDTLERNDYNSWNLSPLIQGRLYSLTNYFCTMLAPVAGVPIYLSFSLIRWNDTHEIQYFALSLAEKFVNTWNVTSSMYAFKESCIYLYACLQI